MNIYEKTLIERHTLEVHTKLKNAVVGIAGLGGLGSNVAVSLARIGVGHLHLVDFDIVDYSNLNRQYYFIKHIGMNKTDALKNIISEINPNIKVTTHKEYVKEDNVKQIFDGIKIIVEAFDNPISKAVLVNTILPNDRDKVIVAASGMGGYKSSNSIKTRKINNRFYLVGDGTSGIEDGNSLMAPRVAIAANHEANMVLRLILGKDEI